MLKSTLEQWRMFKAVAEHGGFIQAADAIHKSQSTIHHAVHKLEQVLGVQLLEIVGRKTTLTAAGELLLRRINYLLAEAERMEIVAHGLKVGVESKLVIAVDEAFPRPELYKVLDSVSLQYPLLRIELIETILSGANELLMQGKVEISLSPYTMPQNLNEEICQIEFIAVAAASHPLHQLDHALELEDLKSTRQIVLRDSAVERKQDVGWLGSEQRWTVSHIGTSIDLLLKGLGFAWLPLPALEEHLQSGQLKALPLARGGRRKVQFYLNFSDADLLGPVARAFIGELRYQTRHLPLSDD